MNTVILYSWVSYRLHLNHLIFLCVHTFSILMHVRHNKFISCHVCLYLVSIFCSIHRQTYTQTQTYRLIEISIPISIQFINSFNSGSHDIDDELQYIDGLDLYKLSQYKYVAATMSKADNGIRMHENVAHCAYGRQSMIQEANTNSIRLQINYCVYVCMAMMQTKKNWSMRLHLLDCVFFFSFIFSLKIPFGVLIALFDGKNIAIYRPREKGKL